MSNFVFADALQTALKPLRTVSEVAVSLDMITRIIVFIIALVLFVIAFLAYQRTKSNKLIFVLAAFSLFALKWLLKLIDLFVSPGSFFSDPSENIFELFILAALFLAIFKK